MMTGTDDKIVTLPRVEDIEAEAAAWLALLGREDVSAANRSQLKEWLSKSERHREIFADYAALWDEMDILQELEDIGKSETLPADDAVRGGVSRRAMFGAIAASVLAVATGVGFWSYNHQSLTQNAVFLTSVGEQRTVKLSDGSVLWVNTDSRVEVHFSKERRFVRLTQGEAHFEVAKNKKRPFFVNAGTGFVRAVGTSFAVRLRPNNEVEVTVEEGRVALSAYDTARTIDPHQSHTPDASQVASEFEAARSLVELTAGQNAIFGDHIEKLDLMQQSDINRKLSWRQGLLAYAGDPLADVVSDISRYTDVRIEIADPSLQQLPIGGYFRVGEIDALFDSLEVTFGLHVEHVSDTYVRLSKY